MNRAVAVIGGGISGLSLAYFFHQQGFLVDVFDAFLEHRVSKRARLLSASKCAQGVATIKGLRLADTPLFDAKIKGHEVFKDLLAFLSKEEGLPLMNLGVLEPFVSDQDKNRVMDRVFRRVDLASLNVEILDKAALEEFHVRLSSALDLEGAFYFPDDYTYDPLKVLECLREYLVKNGVRFYKKNIIASNLKLDFATNQFLKIAIDDRLNLKGMNTQDNRKTGKSMDDQKNERLYENVFLATGAHLNHFWEKGFGEALYTRYTPGIAIKLEVSDGRLPNGLKSGTKSLRADLCQVSVGAFDLKSRRTQESATSFINELQNLDYGQVRNDLLGSFIGSCPEIQSLHREVFVAGMRMSGKRNHPLIGRVSSSDPLWSKVWLFTGFHKSGYSVAPYLASEIAKAKKNGSEFDSPLRKDDLLHSFVFQGVN